MKIKINILLFLLLSLNTYAHIGIATVKGTTCTDGVDSYSGEVGFYVNGNSSPYFSYQIVENKSGKVISTDYVKGSDTDIIYYYGLKEGRYTLVVQSDNNPTCKIIKEFQIKCCTTTELLPITINLDEKGFANGNTDEGFINIRLDSKNQGPFYYHWTSPSGNHYSSQNLSWLKEEGTYCVSVTDGCVTAEACFELTNCEENDALIVDGTVIPEPSPNAGNGAVDITIKTNGSGPFTITWFDEKGNILISQNGVYDLDLKDVTAGTYKVKVEENGACKIAYFKVYTCDLSAITPQVSITKPSTVSSSDGSIKITIAASQNKNVTYSWHGKNTGYTSNDKDIFNLKPDTYCLTIKDENCGLVFEECYELIPDCQLKLNSIIVKHCTSVDIYPNPINGTAPYTYTWTGGVSSNDEKLLLVGAGQYILHVEDSKGCKTGEYYFINKSDFEKITYYSNVTPEDCHLGAIELFPAGSQPPYYYSWPNGLTGGINKLSNLKAGSYSIIISSVNGCTTTANIDVPLIKPTLQIATPPCFIDMINGAANVQASYGDNPDCAGCTYSWSDGVTGKTRTFPNIGTYSVVVKSADGICEATAIYNVLAIQVYNDCSAEGDLFGTGGIVVAAPGLNNTNYKIEWKPLGTTGIAKFDLKAGVYDLKITAPSGCALDKSITVSKATFGNFIASPIHCEDKKTKVTNWGENLLFPVSAYRNGVKIFTSNNSKDDMIITSDKLEEEIVFRDTKGCEFSKKLIFEDRTLYAKLTTTKKLCANSTVSLYLEISGYYSDKLPVEYELFFGGKSIAGKKQLTQNSIEVLKASMAGEYTVVVTKDIGGGSVCSTTNKFTLENAPPISFEDSVIDPCGATNNGNITLTENSKYTYTWSNNKKSFANPNLGPGIYTVKIVDDNFCSVSKTYELKQDNIKFVALAPCKGQENGSIAVEFRGNKPKYLWSTEDISSKITNIGEGSYCITITDNRPICKLQACYDLISDPIVNTDEYCRFECNGVLYRDPTKKNIAQVTQLTQCNSTTKGIIEIFAFSQATYTLLLNGKKVINGVLNGIETFSNLEEGDYKLELTDVTGNLCKQLIKFTIKCCEPDNETLIPSWSIKPIDKGADGEISINTNVPGLFFSWTGPSGIINNSNNFLNNIGVAGNYCVNVSGQCTQQKKCFEIVKKADCDKIEQSKITTSVKPACESLLCPQGSISISGFDPKKSTFQWSNGASTLNIASCTAGIYTFSTKSLINGCISKLVITVGQEVTTKEKDPNKPCVYVTKCGGCESRTGGILEWGTKEPCNCDLKITCFDGTEETKSYPTNWNIPKGKTNSCSVTANCLNPTNGKGFEISSDFCADKAPKEVEEDGADCFKRRYCKSEQLNIKFQSDNNNKIFIGSYCWKKYVYIEKNNGQDAAICIKYAICDNKVIDYNGDGMVTDADDVNTRECLFQLASNEPNVPDCDILGITNIPKWVQPSILNKTKRNNDNQISENILYMYAYPNPFSNFLNVEFYAVHNEVVTLELTDLVGRKLVSQQYDLTSGENNLRLSTDDVPNGVVLLSLTTEKGKKVFFKLVNIN